MFVPGYRSPRWAELGFGSADPRGISASRSLPLRHHQQKLWEVLNPAAAGAVAPAKAPDGVFLQAGSAAPASGRATLGVPGGIGLDPVGRAATAALAVPCQGRARAVSDAELEGWGSSSSSPGACSGGLDPEPDPAAMSQWYPGWAPPVCVGQFGFLGGFFLIFSNENEIFSFSVSRITQFGCFNFEGPKFWRAACREGAKGGLLLEPRPRAGLSLDPLLRLQKVLSRQHQLAGSGTRACGKTWGF